MLSKPLLFAAGIALAALSSCTAPIQTRGVQADLAGRCKLMAYNQDKGYATRGLIGLAIAQSNVNERRQDIYDSCVAAAGSRETPATMPPQ